MSATCCRWPITIKSLITHGHCFLFFVCLVGFFCLYYCTMKQDRKVGRTIWGKTRRKANLGRSHHRHTQSSVHPLSHPGATVVLYCNLGKYRKKHTIEKIRSHQRHYKKNDASCVSIYFLPCVEALGIDCAFTLFPPQSMSHCLLRWFEMVDLCTSTAQVFTLCHFVLKFIKDLNKTETQPGQLHSEAQTYTVSCPDINTKMIPQTAPTY